MLRDLPKSRVARRLLAALWPPAVISWLYLQTSTVGFNVLDEGLMASYVGRLLDGQVPHQDFISPRPLLSAVLHIPDLALPLALFPAERLVGISEVTIFSALAAWIVFRRAPWAWTVPQSGLVAASVLVNLNTTLQTPWYTLDGLILVAGAILAMRAGLAVHSTRLIALAFLLAGLAVGTKQSFATAPLVLLAWLGWMDRSQSTRRRLRRLVVAATITASPMVAYMTIVTLAGGLPDAVAQLTGGRLVWGQPLLEIMDISGGLDRRWGVLFIFAVVVGIMAVGRRDSRTVLSIVSGAVVLALALGMTIEADRKSVV